MKKEKHNGISIKTATAVYFIVVILVLTIAISGVGYNFYKTSVMDSYTKYVTTVLDYAHTVTEEYLFGDMIGAREMPEEYEVMRSELNKVKESSDVDYIYAVYFDDINDVNSLTYAINAKTAEELSNGATYTYLGKPCEEGAFSDDALRALRDAVITQKTDEGQILQTYSQGYGYMFNGYKVIFDSAGNPEGLICVEINVNNIHEKLNKYIRNVTLIFFVLTLIMIVIFVGGAEHFFSYPIAKLTGFVGDFIKNIGDQDALEKSARELKTAKVRSVKEIENLYSAISKLESDMADQYRDIRRYSENLLKMQDGLIILIADMVEYRDSNTGNHIQKTAAYVRIILDGLKRKDYYSEQLTPQYMEYVVKSAPLHDTGKIKIPDSILNKPGNLTPEEFEIMKKHTVFGKEIIDKVIRTVEGESYLAEARNMAAYHHERWDGKGYPEGLKGEEIPLSARIMAVADVFDAFTSDRVYKPAFTKEKSLELILEGKGTRFDPKCVEVFLEAVTEIDAVLRKYGTKE